MTEMQYAQSYDEGWHRITIGEGKERLQGNTQSRPMKKIQYVQLYGKGWHTITIGEGKIV